MAATGAGHSGGAALAVNPSGLHAVAAQLAAAGDSLAVLAAHPMAHPPLAADETSGSVAARLSEHGAVLASRAGDAAAVLHSGAAAIIQAAQAYMAMDEANREVVALAGNPGPTPALSPAAAVTANAVAAEVPTMPPVPRLAEITAAIMEAGNPHGGAEFIDACGAVAQEFRACGAVVRGAAAAAGANLQGQAGLPMTAALTRFAEWTQQMAAHADALAQWATSHQTQFAQAQQQTPKTMHFAASRRELAQASALFASHPGPPTAAAVNRAQTGLTSLNDRTLVVAAGYHDGPAPLAPPCPPPLAPPIVNTPGPQPQPPGQSTAQPPGANPRGDGTGGGDDGGGPDDLDGTDLGLEGDPELNPAGQALPGMAAMLPSMLSGALGGAIGAASHIPQSVGQQVQGLASQAMQGLGGLGSALGDPAGDIDRFASPAVPDDIPAAGAGGGGETAPAASPGQLGPAGHSMFAMSAPPATGLPLGGPSSVANPAGLPEAAGPMGGPMMMPMGAGMGGGAGAGTRAVKEPDKAIEVPPLPNSEPVKGEAVRRHTAVSEAAPPPGADGKPAVKVSSRRRPIEVPQEGGRK